MRADVGALRATLSAVRDPEIGRTYGELGMLADVEVDRRGRARAALRLTNASCPFTAQIRADLTAAAAQVDGITSLEVEFGELTARERATLADGLRAGAGRLPDALGSTVRIHAVASKGGVGKSSVTANLAVAPARSALRVGVLDADVWGYSIPQLFGVRRSPVVVGGRCSAAGGSPT